MYLFLVSYFAGILTAAAPCILPLLPVIIGGSVIDQRSKSQWQRPLIITGSLAASVVVFGLLLKASTALLGVPQLVWNSISGGVVIILGISILFPKLWERIAIASGIYGYSNSLMRKTGSTKPGLFKDVLMGASLGPVFSSCSPTYALIVAIILPQSFWQGLIYLKAYALGLATVLLLAALAGQKLVKALGWLSSPTGLFRIAIGVTFLVVGSAVIIGLDREFQAFVLENGWYDPVAKIEEKLN